MATRFFFGTEEVIKRIIHSGPAIRTTDNEVNSLIRARSVRRIPVMVMVHILGAQCNINQNEEKLGM